MAGFIRLVGRNRRMRLLALSCLGVVVLTVFLVARRAEAAPYVNPFWTNGSPAQESPLPEVANLAMSPEGVDDKALKIYKSASRPERTEREVSAITRCAHPHIAKFEKLGSVQVGGETYLYSIEEFLSGGTFADRLREGPLAIDEVRRLAEPLIDTLAQPNQDQGRGGQCRHRASRRRIGTAAVLTA